MLPPRWSGWLGKILLSTNYLWEGCLYNPMMPRYSHVPKTKVTLPSPELSSVSTWELLVAPYILPCTWDFWLICSETFSTVGGIGRSQRGSASFPSFPV